MVCSNMTHFYNFVDGKFTEKIKNFQIKINPNNLKEDYRFSDSDFLDIVASVQAAHKAQKRWQEMGSQERKLILNRFAELILKNKDLLAQLESEDSGMPIGFSQQLCLQAHHKFLRCIEHQFESHSNCVVAADRSQSTTSLEYIISSPVGIMGIITDWQQSILTICENLAASLACANTLILHPSEFSIRSALKLAEISIEAGVPPGVINVLLARGDEFAELIVEHPAIKHIRFYGENAVGEKLYKSAAENNKRIFLSLGANNAAIVFQDCDLVEAVKNSLDLTLGFHFFGRKKINRVFIQEKILNDFKSELTSQLASRMAPQNFDNSMGPMPCAHLKSRFDAYIAQSKLDRAKVFFEGSENEVSVLFQRTQLKSDFLALPIIYEDLTNCSTLHQESLVGPILFIQSFKYAHELSKTLGSSPFANCVYIWTEDITRIYKLGSQLDVGCVYVNSLPSNQDQFSHTILKNSGLGDDGIKALFDFNLYKKLISIKTSDENS